MYTQQIKHSIGRFVDECVCDGQDRAGCTLVATTCKVLVSAVSAEVLGGCVLMNWTKNSHCVVNMDDLNISLC